MENSTAVQVVDAIKSTLSFGGAVSGALHSLGAQDGIAGCNIEFLLIADGTTRVLSQVQSLVLQNLDVGKASLFNQAGLNYVKLATDEVLLVFLKFEAMIMGTAKGKGIKSLTSITGSAQEEIEKRKPISIDEAVFLGKMEANDSIPPKPVFRFVDSLRLRLRKLKDHLHLIHQVISVHALTKSLGGMKDLSLIVESYDRIQRTARMTGVSSGYKRSSHRLPRNSRTLIYSSSESSSEADDNKSPIRRRFSPKSSTETLKPAPFAERNNTRSSIIEVVDISPPAPSCSPSPEIVVPTTNDCSSAPRSFPPTPQVPASAEHSIKPPEYSEKEHLGQAEQQKTTDPSVASIPTAVGSPIVAEKPKQSEDRDVKQKDNDACSVTTYATSSSNATSNISTNGNDYVKDMKSSKWRFKRFFRSKASLESELQNNLREDNKYLSAYLLQGGKSRKIPHSAIHSVEWTHIHTIIAQMKGNGWYNTFVSLDSAEQRAYKNMITSCGELLALKIIKTNQRNAWVKMLVRLAGGSNDLPHLKDGRIILAIMREDESDSESDVSSFSSSSESEDESPRRLPPPPSNDRRPGAFRPPFFRRSPPPKLQQTGECTVCVNAGIPLPYSNSCDTNHCHHRPEIRPLVVPKFNAHALGGPPPPTNFPNNGPPGRPFQHRPPPNKICSVRISDVTPLFPRTEKDALQALTSYEAYSLRLDAPADRSVGLCWSRCNVINEQHPQSTLRERVDLYLKQGWNIINDRHLLNEPQAVQVSRLIDGLNANETDNRFTWTLVVLEFLNSSGLRINIQHKPLATGLVYVIAQRQPLENLNVFQVFDSLKRTQEQPMMMPLPPSPPPRMERSGRRIYDSDTDGYDSDSSVCSSDSARSCRHGRGRKGKVDPICVKLNPEDKEKDILQQLLKLWTVGE